ncbi:hypothetical protein THAOC_27580, partial [Thalassiosira oceanica]
ELRQPRALAGQELPRVPGAQVPRPVRPRHLPQAHRADGLARRGSGAGRVGAAGPGRYLFKGID